MTFSRRDLLRIGTFGAAALAWPAAVWAQGKKPWETWESTTPPVRGGYFRRAATLDVGLLNPNHWPVNDWLVINMFYEKLLITDGSFRPVPWLAESRTFPDPLTCLMKLRKGIRFADGEPLNAAAVKVQMEWIKDPKNGAWTSGWLKPLRAVEVADEHTIRWKFEEPWGGFLGEGDAGRGRHHLEGRRAGARGHLGSAEEPRLSAGRRRVDLDLRSRPHGERLYHPTGGFNYGRSKNDAAIALIEKGRREVDTEKRRQIYWDLEKVVYDSCEDVWVFWEMWPSAYRKHVQGYDHPQIVKHKEIWAWSHPLWFKDGRA